MLTALLGGYTVGVAGALILIVWAILGWQNMRKLQRLRAAAMAVLTDWRERELYPGWYRQPALSNVMGRLADAVKESM